MSLEAIAKAYTERVELEERIRLERPDLNDAVGVLRADLHALLMESLREARIPFADRSNAARIAYQIVQSKL